MPTKTPRTVYEHDNWGNLIYNFKRDPGDYTDEPALKAGEKVWVLFKSGRTFLYKIVAIPHTAHINDMGHEYNVHTDILGINIDHEGHKLFMPLKGLKVTPL